MKSQFFNSNSVYIFSILSTPPVFIHLTLFLIIYIKGSILSGSYLEFILSIKLHES